MRCQTNSLLKSEAKREKNFLIKVPVSGMKSACLPSLRLGGTGVVAGLTGIGVVTGGGGVVDGSSHFPGVSLISSKAISLR